MRAQRLRPGLSPNSGASSWRTIGRRGKCCWPAWRQTNADAMPLVYQVECLACGQPPEVRREVRGFVPAPAEPADPGAASAERPKWTAVSEGYLGLRLDSGELVCL